MALNSRERVRIVLDGGRPDRVPFNFWMDRDLMADYDREFGENFRVTYYGADVIEAILAIPWWPEVARPKIGSTNTDWQVESLIPDLRSAERLQLPDPASAAIYQPVLELRRRHPDKSIWGTIPTPLEAVLGLRLFGDFCLDIYDHPGEVKRLLSRVTEVMAEIVRRVCALDIDALYMAGDISGRNGPLMSPDHLEKFGFIYMEPLIAAAKAAGKPVFFHTDGAVMDLLELVVAYGLDGVNPLQYHLHDYRAFAERYGAKLMVYGALDNCYIIPDGKPEEIKGHVQEVFSILGRDGGLILSTHDIPYYTPRANVEAMVGAIKDCRYLG